MVYRPEAPGTGEVHITGTIDYSLGYHIGIDIGSCFEIPPVCLNHFDASVGFEHKANLNVTGHLETPVKKDIDLASQDFWTQIEIGPVPIPVDFKATLSVGVDGQVSVQFSYAASENVALKVGEEYNDGRGWSPIAERTFAVLPGTPQVTGTAKLQTTTDLEVQVLLIGAVGPGLKGSAGLDFDAQIPRNPIWMLSGLASLDVTFVVDVPVLGKLVDYSANILKWEQELARSGNTPPVIRILNGSVNIELGRTLDLGSSDFSSIYRVSDAEDGHVTDVRLSSDRDGPLPNSTYTFPNAGARTVTVTATDSQGASSTATFTVTVTNTPPVVTLTTSGELPVYRGVPFQLSGYATELNPSTGQLTLPVPCERLTWTSSVPSDILPAGCSGNATFGSNGPRTLTLTATGTNGAKGSAHTDISVTDPPANLSPVIDELHIRDALGNEIGDSQVVSTSQALSLSVRAHDPENDPIHYYTVNRLE
ncbi:PKD domain-containing protein [Deinococcus ruber]|uniref:PKD domain-containing protein n=1 Tax=Deinococcus ruber TaxID=1848197 RepID=A0A918FHR6_9DEIO|nr:PKD domain-containing protein [Deinococcus ruber]GGR38482.1 hypothetical protein GCM10008957_54510 [Deinococcus ruber]